MYLVYIACDVSSHTYSTELLRQPGKKWKDFIPELYSKARSESFVIILGIIQREKQKCGEHSTQSQETWGQE